MNLGISQTEITPNTGVELSGFAARVQPSTGVLDPLFARALFLVSGSVKLLWVHCDLIGLDRSIVAAFRQWAREAHGLRPDEVMLSASHTHAGPGTIHLREAGEYDAHYVEFLQRQMRAAAGNAMAKTEEAGSVAVEGRLDLAVDRRKTASAHTDPRVGALGFRRQDGSFAAVVVNYAMHPVALGSTNRSISADIFGAAADALRAQLPGNPVVLLTNGACGNLNPPAENVSFAQVKSWGEQIATAVAPLLRRATPGSEPEMRLLNRLVALPLDTLDADGINRFADKALLNAGPIAEWGDKYRRVVEHWRATLLRKGNETANGHHEAELFGVRLGGVTLVGANAEVFSEFTDRVRRSSGISRLWLVGYANGDMGYLPTCAAYDEGGYEVEVAHLFYGGFRLKKGGFESLARAASQLVVDLQVNP
ncbi:MAG TPA: neutral/alkaline non-lysosomal ceramidase N-terminal domain-containing protein [Candidatus Paceibacterota bacterium]|nr:neutral/alkaline non-lysosomal ceramidase N-terminal domain-containing protein [Verrucomicrobiota bacterium]HSA12379.1 neutral/alkaline non-lysosomal ceramidase N-terminal domain-containing protein [Candidatus Paceibacterota bacterium]